MGGERGGERRDEGVVLARWRWWDHGGGGGGGGGGDGGGLSGQLRTSRPRIANDPPSFRGLGGFCCLPDRLVSCRRLLGPKIEKRHLRLAARSGGVGTLPTGSVPRCASLKLFWMSSKVPAPGRAAGGGGALLLNAPPIATAPTRGAAALGLRQLWHRASDNRARSSTRGEETRNSWNSVVP